jgi:ABC-type transport system involved in multi-copper enzyme maturation permease subunit
MSKSKRRSKTKTVAEKPPEPEEPTINKIGITLGQSTRLFWEEIKNSYRGRFFILFAIFMVLPMMILLISYAVTGFPTYFNEVQMGLFLNGIYNEAGGIQTFRDVFATLMGMGFATTGFATLWYTGIPVGAVVALMTCGMIASERDKGTLPIFVSKPVYKTQIVLTKFLAFAFTSLLLTAAVFYTIYFVLAFSILAPLGILATGVSFTIYAANLEIIGTWVFILAVGSITLLISSLVDRPLVAGVIAIMFILLIYFLSSIFSSILLGGAGSSLGYISPSTLANTILNININSFGYYYAESSIYTTRGPGGGFFARILIGTQIDPGVAAIMLISIILITLVLACILTETREVK